ncbi:peroxiredoxin [Thalassovita mangrovi]|uniref:Glutathione-dependent peroxiredoxin n=1 Tax=Thalassovita mangrovi TaxID=2692236 RepID=A0A6L8LHQ9_9RHOB|nr:peroxiredoxin [Thalassovita mangrovi]MYM55538.1 redoxin family protein [Thalassovita mangrovi]
MTISVGDHLPEAVLSRLGDEGPETVSLADKTKGRKVVIFAVPAAFSSTCQTAHMPSFIRTKDQFAAKGVDEIICVAVNDLFVVKEWDQATGAGAAGITLLADADGSFTKSIGMEFDAPALGFFGRSKRYAMLVEDGVVTLFQPEQTRGCETSSGEALLAAM